MKNFTILLYHDLRTGDSGIDREGPDNSPYVLDSESFQNQMKGLSSGGFPVISLAELVQSFREDVSFRRPSVCLTFDDGHVSNFTHAFPTLRHFGFTACFFLTVNEIGTRQALSWPQIRSMAEVGMEIGSHGLTHVPTSSLHEKELFYQLRTSKRILEDGLGKLVRFFSSPTGYPDPRIRYIARDLGYEAVCVGPVAPGRNAKDPFALTRIDVKRGLSTRSLIRLASNDRFLALYYRGKEETLFWAKRCLGFHGYERIRRTLLTCKTILGGSACQNLSPNNKGTRSL